MVIVMRIVMMSMMMVTRMRVRARMRRSRLIRTTKIRPSKPPSRLEAPAASPPSLPMDWQLAIERERAERRGPRRERIRLDGIFKARPHPLFCLFLVFLLILLLSLLRPPPGSRAFPKDVLVLVNLVLILLPLRTQTSWSWASARWRTVPVSIVSSGSTYSFTATSRRRLGTLKTCIAASTSENKGR